MKNQLSFFTLFFVSFFYFNSNFCFSKTSFNALSVEAKKIQSEMSKAKNCLPKFTSTGVQFCTGFTLKSDELKKILNMTQNKCLDEIKNNGYFVSVSNKNNKHIPKKDWDSFINSTQRALTFHDYKTVAFKGEGGRIDCIHELIHVYQWNKVDKAALSPENRSKTIESFTQKLNEEINKIEKLEKSGDKIAAQARADSLQKYMDLLKSYALLSDGLDEVEAYYFIYKNCKELKCTEEDFEISLANLDKRKDFLGDKVLAEIQSEVKNQTREKFKKYSEPVISKWKSLSESELKKVSEYLLMNWDSLLKEVKSKGLGVIAINPQSTHNSPLLDGERIPKDVFQSLATPQKAELQVLQSSQIMQNQALGKFLCFPNHQAIVLTPDSTQGTLVHEYMHFLQSKKNSEYCNAITLQQEVALQFKTGKITKDQYEKTIITYQIINALAEKEVYSFLTKQTNKSLGKREQLNNNEMLKKYTDFLNF